MLRERRPRSTRQARTAAAAAVAILVGGALFFAIGRSDDRAEVADARTLITDLCDLRASAAAADAGAVRVQFFDRAHEPLHRLARQLDDGHRGQAARLLEAKQVVESQLTQGRAPDPVEDLDPLIAETGEGLALLGADIAPSCALEEATE